MEPPPSLQQRRVVFGGQIQHPPGIARRAWANHFTDRRAMQINHDDPTRSEDMNMGGRMIVRIHHKMQPADAEDRWHQPI
jgi:hypothetical protein